ncbi:hypothetical protein [Deinococcus sonorensis]|uniref:ADP ribosyltransferase domain-containing protein n=2 Tax=Deinococcus sonorensis TaxID=309891 RepID=A0AAU7UER0_9DEIO
MDNFDSLMMEQFSGTPPSINDLAAEMKVLLDEFAKISQSGSFGVPWDRIRKSEVDILHASFDKWLSEHEKGRSSSLSGEELIVAQKWRDGNYASRIRLDPTSEDSLRSIDNLSNAMQRTLLQNEVLVYRGIKGVKTPILKNNNFIAVSLSRAVALGFTLSSNGYELYSWPDDNRFLMAIYLPRGLPALHINNTSEKELLLPRNLEIVLIRTICASDPKDGRRIFICKVINSHGENHPLQGSDTDGSSTND